MAKAKWVLTAAAQTKLAKALGRQTESVSVYDQADLDRRLAAARAAGVKVTVRKAND